MVSYCSLTNNGEGYKGPQEDDGPQVDVGDKLVNFCCGLFTQRMSASQCYISLNEQSKDQNKSLRV